MQGTTSTVSTSSAGQWAVVIEISHGLFTCYKYEYIPVITNNITTFPLILQLYYRCSFTLHETLRSTTILRSILIYE